MKLLRNGIDFIFFDRIYRIDGIVFALGEEPFSAEGRFIPMILLILSNFLLKIRIHSYFCCILIVSIFDQTGRFSGQRQR
ncbi:hypothetical protein D1AOALGA4SA_9093 [Olavius algarvensis Delta 1 endosymbiont]|nr:hypothetical protein D1AOALGA4SA_9093 [Olavius algarvensis Delta 1 endosymbiont]